MTHRSSFLHQSVNSTRGSVGIANEIIIGDASMKGVLSHIVEVFRVNNNNNNNNNNLNLWLSVSRYGLNCTSILSW